ncbi:SGNH/GDSL hydrolase family protein [Ramlibacter sp. PS3R-8]|uniref:SGNH/GDSL hydrolase family protein n=1 Tax=Ramlibacter sp. PS3R-8 TaxID=3133437 RepID=UPI0030A22ADE
MATQWLRRGWLAACASALLLVACGGGDIVDPFSPARVVTFGDAMADLGQNGSRYTVNDGTLNVWTEAVSVQYGLTTAPSSTGGFAYATGNARVAARPDAAGSNATPTVKEQIDTFLATGTLGDDDLILISAGTSDVIAEAQKVITGAQSEDQMLDALGQAGRALGAQVKRLVDAGALHVVVAGPYNLGRSPWAFQVNQGSLLESASSRFNQQFLIYIKDLGENVLYVDAALYFNQVTGNPAAYDLNELSPTAVVCTSVDPGPGIGTGSGEVNSNLCTPNTLAAGREDYTRYVFADRVYPTPRGHQLFGDYVYDRIKERF